MSMDVMAVGAHPDDVEVGIGGLVHKLASRGRKVAVLDLTRGEMGSRGTPEERLEEAAEAAHILGVAERANAELSDGGIANTQEQRRAVIPFVRKWRPRVLFAPMRNDRHPDHDAAHFLVRDANYFAGLTRIETGQEAYRAPRVYYYAVYGERAIPDLVADITGHLDAKLEALAAYRSQFHNPDYAGPATYVSSPEFWESFRTRAHYLGGRIGVDFGEPLYCDAPLGVDVPPGLEDGL